MKQMEWEAHTNVGGSTKAPQAAVRVPLPDLLFAKRGRKGLPGVRKT